MTLRLGLVASALASSFALPPAQAACTPPASTFTACAENRPLVAVCVYLSSTCTPVTAFAPLCIYGNIGAASYITVWC